MTSSSDEDKQKQNANNADTVGRDKSNNSENNNNSIWRNSLPTSEHQGEELFE